VVSNEGTGRATVTAIAKDARVSLSTLYRHFESREDLLQQAIQAPLVQFVQRWQETVPQTAPIQDDVERLRLYITTIYEAAVEHRGLIQTLLVELPAGGELFTTKLSPMLGEVIDQLVEIGLDQARQQGIDEAVIPGGVRIVTLLTLMAAVLGPGIAVASDKEELITFLARFSAFGIRQS
jgi:AcrR family transcriptional regulator